ncbi:hypothetical protein QUB80_12755 [Chlorogloeopsis sp. ULAP01]|uniref:hypothetical protein n=1 Tax=Chlorogloeopsis sp. ULAP01 TaxID=3056483 RepID=UPI0025AA69B4|nr:hypothetical protein [Chlorogloeopsis sp. ULAP01]MDM9381571.1 hypothetical protein [Chlorogloeopsis sp. ULAP01]
MRREQLTTVRADFADNLAVQTEIYLLNPHGSRYNWGSPGNALPPLLTTNK